MSFGTAFDLFGLAIAAALIAGAIVPLLGCFLYLRRTSFHGIVLPQFAAAGIACGFVVLPLWGQVVGLPHEDVQHLLQDTHAALNYHLFWAATFTFGGLLGLALLGRRGGSEVGRLAASFALASAATVLFAHASPTGDVFVHELLRGEILFVGVHELETLAVGLGIVLAATIWLHRDFTLVSYDPDTARVLGLRVGLYELALHGLVGLGVSVGVMSVGPVVLFGLLVLPPLAVRCFTRTMVAFFVASSALGLLSAAIGVGASFAFDAPLGPCLVIAAGALLVPALFRRRGLPA